MTPYPLTSFPGSQHRFSTPWTHQYDRELEDILIFNTLFTPLGQKAYLIWKTFWSVWSWKNTPLAGFFLLSLWGESWRVNSLGVYPNSKPAVVSLRAKHLVSDPRSHDDQCKIWFQVHVGNFFAIIFYFCTIVMCRWVLGFKFCESNQSYVNIYLQRPLYISYVEQIMITIAIFVILIHKLHNKSCWFISISDHGLFSRQQAMRTKKIKYLCSSMFFFLSFSFQCNCIILGFYDKLKIYLLVLFYDAVNGWLRYKRTNNNCTTFDTMRSLYKT